MTSAEDEAKTLRRLETLRKLGAETVCWTVSTSMRSGPPDNERNSYMHWLTLCGQKKAGWEPTKAESGVTRSKALVTCPDCFAKMGNVVIPRRRKAAR